MPVVSVIMPVYNAGSWLEPALNSVLQQTLQDIELITVNDGSTDDSRDLLERVSDPRLRIIHQQNSGQSAAINHGVSVCRGRFIKLVDADDWINPEHLESQLHSLEGHPDCVSACRWGYFREDFRQPTVRPECADRDYDDPLEWIMDSLTLDEGMMGGWKWLIPRNVWDRSGGYDARLSLNNDFHASIAILLASAGVRFAPAAVYSYRKGLTGTLSQTYSRRALESALLTTELGSRLLLQREDSQRIRHLCAARFQRWAYDMYPDFPDLADQAERRCSELGGANVPFPGGKFGQTLSRIIGWKAVRNLQHHARRAGWRHIQALKRRLRNR